MLLRFSGRSIVTMKICPSRVTVQKSGTSVSFDTAAPPSRTRSFVIAIEPRGALLEKRAHTLRKIIRSGAFPEPLGLELQLPFDRIIERLVHEPLRPLHAAPWRLDDLLDQLFRSRRDLCIRDHEVHQTRLPRLLGAELVAENRQLLRLADPERPRQIIRTRAVGTCADTHVRENEDGGRA